MYQALSLTISTYNRENIIDILIGQRLHIKVYNSMDNTPGVHNPRTCIKERNTRYNSHITYPEYRVTSRP